MAIQYAHDYLNYFRHLGFSVCLVCLSWLTNYVDFWIMLYIWEGIAHLGLLLSLQYLVHPGALVTLASLGHLAL